MGRPVLIVPDKNCEQCGKTYNRKVRPSGRRQSCFEFKRSRFCSRKCFTDQNCGPNHHFYIDGIRHGHSDGYLRISDGTMIHRLVMEKHIGRPIASNECVHHIDHDILNNDISNLQLMTKSAHSKLHAANKKRNNGTFCK
jgi:hypothetical protein